MPTVQCASILICRNVAKYYTYRLPEISDGYVLGAHVEVPFGRGLAPGIIISLSLEAEASTSSYKTLGPLLEKKPVLSTEILDLLFWFKDHYQLTPHKAYQCIVGRMKYRELETEEPIKPVRTEPPLTRTSEQDAAIQRIVSDQSTAEHFLLHGVTSSGKTEVYMQLADAVMAKGERVLMLLPEIALTPQMRKTFTKRFSDQVAVMHSGQTAKAREIAWNRAYQNQVSILIGPRSTIFAPLENVGLIILDEEHEPSYKQENHTRYLTHVVADYRARYQKARLVYGSATPALESFYRAKQKDLQLIQLKDRVHQRPLPAVDLVDMRDQKRDGMLPVISEPLLQGIRECKDRGEKAMILLNRRGYASYIACQSCGHVHSCKSCGLSYTYHKDKRFRCHRCDITEPITHRCGNCNKNSLSFGGIGTQKLEAELKLLFPDLSIYRLDRDQAKTTRKLESVLKDFRENGDLLIGTQMIAKGHHFEEVTLVGVLGIDNSLNIPDFRCAERSFQLLTQVAGRAGRGEKKGRVLVQTAKPSHYVLKHASTHDFESFYEEELAFREALVYPPFSELVNLIISGRSLSMLRAHVTVLETYFNDKTKEFQSFFQIIGPKPCPYELIRDHHRWHFLFKLTPELMPELKAVFAGMPKAPGRGDSEIRVITDFDPRSIL